MWLGGPCRWGAGVFSNNGPTDAGDECIRDPVQCFLDFAGLSVPVVSGIQFSAVAEVHSSAMDLVDDTLVVRAHEQQSSGRGDPRRPPGIVDRPVTNLSALEPLEHSVRCFTDSFPPSESCVLAGFASGCANVPGILYYMSGM